MMYLTACGKISLILIYSNRGDSPALYLAIHDMDFPCGFDSMLPGRLLTFVSLFLIKVDLRIMDVAAAGVVSP